MVIFFFSFCGCQVNCIMIVCTKQFLGDSPILNNIVDKLHIVLHHGSAFFTAIFYTCKPIFWDGYTTHACWACCTEQRGMYRC